MTEVTRLAELAAATLAADQGQGLAVVETAVRAAMTALGASLLEQLLNEDAGHRGPRIDCGAGHVAGFLAYRTKTVDRVLGPVALRRGYYHCPDRRRGVVPRDDQLGVTGVSLSPGLAAMTAPGQGSRPVRPGRVLTCRPGRHHADHQAGGMLGRGRRRRGNRRTS